MHDTCSITYALGMWRHPHDRVFNLWRMNLYWRFDWPVMQARFRQHGSKDPPRDKNTEAAANATYKEWLAKKEEG